MTRSFRKDERGVAAVEFALIAPIMVLLALATAEVGNMLTTERRLQVAASGLAELPTQNELSTITENQLYAAMTAAADGLYPYPERPMTMRFTCVEHRPNSPSAPPLTANDKVVWSREIKPGATAVSKTEAAGYMPGDRFTRLEDTRFVLPPYGLINDDMHVCMAEIAYDYEPIIAGLFKPDWTITSSEARTPMNRYRKLHICDRTDINDC